VKPLAVLLAACLCLVSCGEDQSPGTEVAVLETSLGTIELSLYPDQAPLAVENFKGLIGKGYYDGVIFHRVIPGFMIQGGDPTGTGFGGESLWGTSFADEFSSLLRFDKPGQVGMANAGPDTNGSQFFITVAAASHLNDKHTIFASVSSGMEVVTTISEVETDVRDRPLDPVAITKARIVRR